MEVAKLPVKGKAVDLGADAAALVERRKRLSAIKDEEEEKAKAVTERLRTLMGDAEVATAGNWKLKRILVPGGPVSFTREPHERFDVRPLKGKVK